MSTVCDDEASGRCYSGSSVIPHGGDSEGCTHDGASSLAAWPDSVAHFVCDGEGKIRSWSRAAEKILGLSGDDAIGKTMVELFSADAPAPTASAPGQLREFSSTRDWTRRTAAGGVRTFRGTSLPLPGSDGESLLLHFLWPTEETTASPTVKPGMGLDAAAAIATRVAHDFNSLLAPVLGNVILLEEEVPRGDHLLPRLNGIREATEAARGFAQRLMTIDPRRKFALEPGHLGQVVRECLPTLRAVLRPEIVLEDHLLEDHLHTPSGSAVPDAQIDSALLNRKQIEQALVQLSLNAQDAMPAGGKISLVLDMVERAAGDGSPRRWVRLRVQDTGRGMEPSLLEHAFELFVSTKVPGCGVGLGLAEVSAIVRHHGGVIEAESTPGKGSTFSICLPSHLPTEGLPSSAQERTPFARASVPAKRSTDETLLLVEDNSMVRRSIENTLRGMGYLVVAVESGERCLDIVRDPERRVDLLITDVVMPEMSGKELIERVHVLRPGLAVLFMSGYDMSTLASRKQAVVTEHFLQKPFDSEDLAQAVRKAIGKGPEVLVGSKK